MIFKDQENLANIYNKMLLNESQDSEMLEEGKKGKGKKPDYLDVDKDGNKKEPMKKALKDMKEHSAFKEFAMSILAEKKTKEKCSSCGCNVSAPKKECKCKKHHKKSM